MKMLIDEQMGVSVRQRDKLITLKQESANLETDLQMLHQKLQDSEGTIKGQLIEIDRVKKLLRKADGSNANKQRIKELEQKVDKLSSDNEVLQDMVRSLKLLKKQREAKAKVSQG